MATATRREGAIGRFRATGKNAPLTGKPSPELLAAVRPLTILPSEERVKELNVMWLEATYDARRDDANCITEWICKMGAL
jgi:hypothetical protein